MSRLTFGNWTADFINGFSSTQTFAAFQSLMQESPLLISLLNSFGTSVSDSAITTSGPTKPQTVGTSTVLPTIYVDPSWLPTGSVHLSFVQLATSIGHELGHALLPSGHNNYTTTSDPSQAIALGEGDEGSAAAAEFIVAAQLVAAQSIGGQSTTQQFRRSRLPLDGRRRLSAI